MSDFDDERCTCSDCTGEDWDDLDDEDDQPWPDDDTGQPLTTVTPAERFL